MSLTLLLLVGNKSEVSKGSLLVEGAFVPLDVLCKQDELLLKGRWLKCA